MFSTLREKTMFDWLTRSDTACPILETLNTGSAPPPLSIGWFPDKTHGERYQNHNITLKPDV